MTTETKRRIRAYKKALPELRERVVAVALLLAMSVSMLGSVSFAWITLSVAPEATGMQTTVAANGNLEIALAQGPMNKVENGIMVIADAVSPGESQVGDSSAAENQSIVDANITWGNLVNVSDPSYGLDQIKLRPALISDSGLKQNPLYGAIYGGDGRVIETGEKYEYASWKKFSEEEARFVVGTETQYGVRAIASTTSENVAGNVTVNQYKKTVEDAYKEITGIYTGMTTNDREAATKLTGGATCIEALDGLVTVFAQDKVNEIKVENGMANSFTPSSCSPYLYNFYEMLILLETALDKEGEALLNMANWQAYKNPANNGNTNVFESIDDLKGKVNKLSNYGVTLKSLKGHIEDYNNLQLAIAEIEEKALECHPDIVDKPKYVYDDISTAVSYLVDIGSTTLDGAKLSSLGFSNIGTIVSNSTKNIVIHEGILKNFEERVINNTDRMYAYMEVTVTEVPVYGTKTVKGNVYTAARNQGDPFRIEDFETCQQEVSNSRSVSNNQTGNKEEIVAKDTYGMAIDVWVRTNYPQAVLTLEGSPIYKDEVITDVDDEGKTVELYVITIDELETDVYRKNGKWYYAKEHSEVSSESMGDQTPTLKTKQIMIGYQGENRIWSDWETMLQENQINKDATTQGAGSCFVFYADPSEQANILKMLESFTIVFINQQGKNIGTARLNTENQYANQGKVTVPLEMVTGLEYTDESGLNHIGVMNLTQNTPEMITAVIYLNGKKLQNENVLEAGELQGQLNIQFGTSTTLVAPKNEELQSQYRTITAEVAVGDKTSKHKDKPIELKYDENGHNAQVKLTIDGEQPERIKGFFVRVINSSQGTRGEEKYFTMNPETGEWTADFTLTTPGNYVFNSVTVDGIQYTLHDGSDENYDANHPGVYIDGLKLESVSTDKKSGTYLKTEGVFPIVVTARVNSVVEPKRVTALFVDESGTKQFTALLAYDSGSEAWIGAANITDSDTYTLRNIVVDGNPLDVPVQNQTTVRLYLGLTAGVYTTLNEDNWSFPMVDENGDGKLDLVTVPLYVRVWNGTSVMTNLSDVMLYYHSDISHMDSDGYKVPLTWTDENGGYYAGVMGVDKMGTFQFNRMTVSLMGSSSTISDLIIEAPEITGYSPLPPEYDSSSADDYQLAISKDAVYKVQLKHHENARSAVGTFMRVDGNNVAHTETVMSSQKETGTGAFVFVLPKDGRWTLTNLHVYAYSGEIDLAPSGNPPITKVVKTPTVTVKYDDAVNDFKNAVVLNSDYCLATQETKTVEIVVTDFEGQPIDAVIDSTWSILHDATKQEEYGGYKGADGKAVLFNGDGKMTETLTADAANGTVSGKTEFVYAGDYNTTGITLNFLDEENENQSYTFASGTPKFAVKSKLPTVTVTGVSASHSDVRIYQTASPSKSDNMISGSFTTFNKYTSSSAAVYMYVAPKSGLFDQEPATIYQPKVQMQLTGVPTTGLTDIKMVFEHDTSDSYDAVFNFALKNGAYSATGAVGGYIQGEASTTAVEKYPKLYPMGKKSVGTIAITYNGTPLIVELTGAITINNPLCPLYIDFNSTSTDGVALPTTPSRIYGVPNKDGAFEITLPATQTWTEAKSETKNQDFTQQGDPTISIVYTTRTEQGCSTTYYHTTYEETETVFVASSSTTTWTRTWTIDKWQIGDPGETITISSNQTVSAILQYSDGQKSTSNSTTKRTITYYTLTEGEKEGRKTDNVVSTEDVAHTIDNPKIVDSVS